ncbi:CIC11C00000005494 [Sungouiella intermedia]|uniref:CIC11C00000005494 n=1 Tax=Sungouiella intermedia TaxID=45354 RepID=A0A1L0BAR8_9ASCO|nr:CIC11C00000005494 [[Candida] intermedia]
MDSEKSMTPDTPGFTPEVSASAEDTHSGKSIQSSDPLLIDKQSLLQKLEGIPTETLRHILTNQVDLEIRLKHKELRLTEEELGKCEAQMLAIRKFFEVPNNVSFQNEPNDFTLKYYDVLSKSLSVNYTKLQQQQYLNEHPTFKENIFAEAEPVHSYRTRSTTSSLRPSLNGPAVRIPGCLYRRTDGVVVKLTCPDCQRSNFSSAQGFLNHSRIAHSKEYTSQDAAALRCGNILPDEFQDEEGLASLKCLKEKNLEATKNLNVNEIYFNGLSNTLNTVHRSSEESIAPVTQDGPSKSEPQKRKASDSESNELMKKLIKNGMAHDAKDYEDLVGEARKEIPNSHLFDDEEEGEITAKSVTPPVKASGGLQLRREPAIRSTKGTPKSTLVNEEAKDLQDMTGTSPDIDLSKPHSEVGGKYENRLRRRKSRGAVGVEVPKLRQDERDDDKKLKRRKSQR